MHSWVPYPKDAHRSMPLLDFKFIRNPIVEECAKSKNLWQDLCKRTSRGGSVQDCTDLVTREARTRSCRAERGVAESLFSGSHRRPHPAMELCCGVSTARHSPALPQRHHRLHPQLNATATSLPSVFLRGQRLQSQRLSQHSLSSSSRGLVQCVSCTYGDSSSQEFGKSGDGRIKNNVQFDLNLPRRSALLEFTCNVCKARTERMINPDAFRRGTVYVQCGGCKAYHQLVDNLNLVKEYDFKNEVDPMRNELDI